MPEPAQAPSEDSAEDSSEDPAPAPSGNKKRGGSVWRRRLLEVAVFLALFAGVRAWQSRDAPSGTAPALTGVTLSGQNVSIDDLPRPLLVHFWATWCGVCQAEEGNIESISEDHHVLTIATQSGRNEAIEAYVESHELTFDVISDPRGQLSQAWGVHAFPTSFIIDEAGEIRTVEVGYTSYLGMKARLWMAEHF